MTFFSDLKKVANQVKGEIVEMSEKPAPVKTTQGIIASERFCKDCGALLCFTCWECSRACLGGRVPELTDSDRMGDF